MSVDRLGAITAGAEQIRSSVVPATRSLGQLGDIANRMRLLQAEDVFAVAATDMDRIDRDMAAAVTGFSENLKALNTTLPPDLRSSLDPLRASWATFVASGQKIAELTRANEDVARTKLYRKDSAAEFEQVRTQLDSLIKRCAEYGDAAAAGNVDAARQARISLGFAMLAAMLICLTAIWFTSQRILRPILATIGIMGRLSARDTGVDIADTQRADEIGLMMRAVSAFRDDIARAETLDAAQREDHRKQIERTQRLDRAGRGFDQAVGGALAQLGQAADELTKTAGHLTEAASTGDRMAAQVANSADDASANVSTVASASDQLASSISEISRQVTNSLMVAREAASEINMATETMAGLADSADKIGSIAGIIEDIAARTNLLALNATIEAARAGDAGKGFAVVASEVKALAGQTGRATGDIASQIGAIQDASRAAVDAMARIDKTILSLNDISSSVAAAIEEQTAATREIARNVQQAATSTSMVSETIGQLATVTGATGRDADAVASAVAVLNEQTTGLRRIVDGYLADVRAISQGADPHAGQAAERSVLRSPNPASAFA